MCTLNPRGRLAAGPRTTLKEIPVYEDPRAVHPKPAGPLSCGAARNSKRNTFVRSPGGRAPSTREAPQLRGRAQLYLCTRSRGPYALNPRDRLPAGPRTSLKEIPLYEVPEAVHPKPAGPPSCGAAHNLCTRSREPCALNPRGRLAAAPRETLKETPLYEVPGAAHPKPAGPRSCGAAQPSK